MSQYTRDKTRKVEEEIKKKVVESGPFHRPRPPRPLPGFLYFSCLHVRLCLTNKWRKWREIKRKHLVFQDIQEITRILNDWMEHKIRNNIIKYICFIMTKIRK